MTLLEYELKFDELLEDVIGELSGEETEKFLFYVEDRIEEVGG